MKKIAITLIALLLFTPCAFAKTGGPIECVGKGKFSLSLNSEYVPEQRMRMDKYSMSDSSGAIEGEWDVEWHNIRMKSNSFFFKLNYGIFDNLDMFVNIGAQRESLDLEYYQFDGSVELFARFIGDYAPCVRGGLKARLFSLGSFFDVGFSTQYLYHRSKLKLYDIEFERINGTVYYASGDIQTSEVQYHSWDVAIYFYKQFKYLTPYIGAKYQNSVYEVKMDSDLAVPAIAFTTIQHYDSLKLNQDMPWIMFWGIDFHINKRLDANIELSTFGSRSVSFGMTWRF